MNKNNGFHSTLGTGSDAISRCRGKKASKKQGVIWVTEKLVNVCLDQCRSL